MSKNTKHTQQNDIPLILGTMPAKWLQRKFADSNTTQNCDEIRNVEEEQTTQRNLEERPNDAVSIGYFLRNNLDELVNSSSGNNHGTPGGKVMLLRSESRPKVFSPDADRLKEAVSWNGLSLHQKVEEEKENVNGELKQIPGLLKFKYQKCDIEEISHKPSIPGVIHLNTMCHDRNSQTPMIDKKDTATKNGFRDKKKPIKESSEPNLQKLYQSPMHVMKPISAPPWFSNLLEMQFAKDLPNLHDTYVGLLHRDAVLDHWDYFIDTHKQILKIFELMLRHHLKFYCEMKVDAYFWKLLFYNVREHLRNKNSVLANERLLLLIDFGLQFYEGLFNYLNNKYLASDSLTGNSVKSEKFEIIAKVAAQKILLNLGDLCRYKIVQTESNDFSMPAYYYKEAQLLIPNNGVPYNQLAIVSIQNRKKLDAVYYHFRSLLSSNAIYTAKESLLVLFDEIRKKYERTENQSSPIHHYKNASNKKNSSKSVRKEVWIRPDGGRRLHRNAEKTSETPNNGPNLLERRFDDMPAADLSCRFTSIYLYVIGKLYTGIGMESIQEHQQKLLIQFKALLKRRRPFLLKRSKLLKIVAMNICIIEHNAKKEHQELRYQTFHFCNQMLGLLIEKSNELLAAYHSENFNDKDTCFSDLNTILQFIKIYFDYLAINRGIWEPIRSEEEYFIDPWAEVEKLFENINSIFCKNDERLSKNEEIILEEDLYLIGFSPITSATENTKDGNFISGKATPSDEIKQFNERLWKINDFQEIFFDNRSDLVRTEQSGKDSSFVLEELNIEIQSVLNTLNSPDENKTCEDVDANESSSITSSKVSSKDLSESLGKSNSPLREIASINIEADNVDDQVSQLAKLKKELEAKTNAKQIYKDKLEEILKYVDSKVYIEVRPKYLLPDTNCFIDCLEDFEQLINKYKRYTLVIPLTVVRELDGLSKGVKLDANQCAMYKQRIHHFDDVSTRAKRSLDFIKNTKTNIKCVTTKGSFINASLFALAEEENVSNDDRILVTALALSKTMSQQSSTNDKSFIQTELVLITTDRNLRVKALSRNLAVSELNEFLQWAKDCNP